MNPHPVDLSLVPSLKYRRQSYEKAKHSLPLCLVLRQMVSVIRYFLEDIGLKPNYAAKLCNMGLSIYIFMAKILLLLPITFHERTFHFPFLICLQFALTFRYYLV